MKNTSNKQSKRHSWRTTALTTAVLMALSMTSISVNSATTRKPIGDLEIYQSAENGKITIILMLDTSLSMNLMDVENNSCDIPNIVTGTATNAINIKTENATPYTRYYCDYGGKKYYTRITRLQDAVFALMNSSQLNSEKVSIGLGQYPVSSVGKILVPAKLIDDAQRTAIKNAVANIRSDGPTPTAYAYAEAAAYMLGTTTINSVGNTSGFGGSVDASKSGSKYISPLAATDSTCDGRGIYFLTDGEPRAIEDALPIMRAALNKNSFDLPPLPASRLPDGSTGDKSGMPATGAFAQALRNASLNPLGQDREILTAVVGFGSVFNIDRVTDSTLPESQRVIRRLSYTDSQGNRKTGDFYNCEKIIGGGRFNIDVKNACNWGAKSHPALPNSGGYGEGGFYSAQSTDDVIRSVVNFVGDLNQTLSAAPSGTITIPNDPYQASNQLAYAYLPMLAPDVASNASIWKGNLKKYKLNKGTLFGNSNKPLYANVAGNLNNTTQDIWQSIDYKNPSGATANNDVRAGGVYAQLIAPSSIGSVRKVYVEDIDTQSNKPILRKLSVSTTGSPEGFDRLEDPIYTQANQRRLLNFLGFEKATYGNGKKIDLVPMTEDNISGLTISELTLERPTNEIKILGGVVHSKPTAISYSATLDENGRVTDDLSKRDDYVLFGSMDGALHLVDSDNGKEVVAIIPKIMLEVQPQALVKDSQRDDLGNPYFGVDAPWLVTTDYKYDLPAQATETTAAKSGKVTVDNSTEGKGMFAYGGLRMGGAALYGMDITDKGSPKSIFTITPQGLATATTKKVENKGGFERLGQIWSKPTAARIRLAKGDANPTDVLIFGGGYDIKYEDENYVASSNTPAKGNAIYIINANTGELIWSASKDSNAGSTKTSGTNENMLHSITGEITILDRDNDGLMDHIYAADLGGQVFRADFENARPEKFGFVAVDNFSNKRVTRILDTAPTVLANKKFAYRFYERPVVSFYRSEGGTNNGNIFALVNVISGNRSSPLSTLRSNNDNANRVYGIIDTDVGRSDLFTAADTSLGMNNSINEGSLVNLAATLGNTPTEDKKKQAKALLLGTAATSTTASVAAKKGWYYPLTRFDGYNNVRYNKGVGDSVVINNLLYTTVYNPDKQYGTVDSCSAKITGGSERQVYCLPYGICMDSASTTGTGGFTPAGQGIQELTLGAFNDKNTNLKVLIGTTTITDRILADNRNDYNIGSGSGFGDTQYSGSNGGNSTPKPIIAGGDGSAVEYIFNERYTLQPRAWYERQQ